MSLVDLLRLLRQRRKTDALAAQFVQEQIRVATPVITQARAGRCVCVCGGGVGWGDVEGVALPPLSPDLTSQPSTQAQKRCFVATAMDPFVAKRSTVGEKMATVGEYKNRFGGNRQGKLILR